MAADLFSVVWDLFLVVEIELLSRLARLVADTVLVVLLFQVVVQTAVAVAGVDLREVGEVDVEVLRDPLVKSEVSDHQFVAVFVQLLNLSIPFQMLNMLFKLMIAQQLERSRQGDGALDLDGVLMLGQLARLMVVPSVTDFPDLFKLHY